MIVHAYPHPVFASIPDALIAADHRAVYGDPIDTMLGAAGAGTVLGADARCDEAGRVVAVELDVALADLDGSLETLRRSLCTLGAPGSSVLRFSRHGVSTAIAVETGAPIAEPAPAAPHDREPECEMAHDNRDVDESETAFDPALVAAIAAQVRESYRGLMVEAFHVAAIDPAHYDEATFAWYAARTADFARHGFVALGDHAVVPSPSTAAPAGAPFARRFVSADGLQRAEIFEVHPPAGGEPQQVLNLVTELSDGRFVWSSTAPQQWETPPHVVLARFEVGIDIDAFVAGHAAHVAAAVAAAPTTNPVALSSLAAVLASEHRCQARTAEFRRAQGVPSVAELERLGADHGLAVAVHAALTSPAVADLPEDAATDGEWQVTTVELPLPSGGPLGFDALIQYALDQGTAQVEAAGSPLNPFLVTDTGRAHFFVCLAGDGDPIEVALRTLRADSERPAACALVLDTRITTRDGTVSDAILVMASRRGEPEGVTWAQAYKPKGWFRKFKVLPFREQVATSRSLFDAADAGR